jgi:branched-chain amino acid transport system permease protein
MLELSIALPAVINGVMAGAVYALVALGLTLIYGVLHIINFAHGNLLMIALYAVFFLLTLGGVDPYAALPIMIVGAFAAGYLLYRFVIGTLSHGKDQNVLLVTLGLAIVLENLALWLWTGDTRTIQVPYGYAVLDLGFAFLPVTKVIAFFGSLAICGALWALIALTDLGKAIRAVAKERQGARLVGINVEHIFATSYGIGIACLGAAACFLLPTYYVSPTTGDAFVIVAFTIVVLGGMGSFVGALVGGLIIGVTESLGGLFLGESLGHIGISVIFILILLFRPTGLFGAAR